MSFWICLKFRRARLIECDILAGYPSENMILRRRFPEESCYAKGLPGNKCGTFVEDSPEGDSPENHVTQRVSPGTNVGHSWKILRRETPRRIMLRRGPYITGTNVRKFVEPDIDSPQKHALRNLFTKLSLHICTYRG